MNLLVEHEGRGELVRMWPKDKKAKRLVGCTSDGKDTFTCVRTEHRHRGVAHETGVQQLKLDVFAETPLQGNAARVTHWRRGFRSAKAKSPQCAGSRGRRFRSYFFFSTREAAFHATRQLFRGAWSHNIIVTGRIRTGSFGCNSRAV